MKMRNRNQVFKIAILMSVFPLVCVSAYAEQGKKLQSENWNKAYAEWLTPSAIKSFGIQFSPAVKSFEAIKLEKSDDPEWPDELQAGVVVGTFQSGKYKGAQLIRANFIAGGPCKGDGCDMPQEVRFAKNRDHIVYLTEISDRKDLFREEDSSRPLIEAAFQKIGLKFSVDTGFKLPLLDTWATIKGPSPRQILNFQTKGEGLFDPNEFDVVFHHDVLGTIRRPKEDSESSSDKFFAFLPDGTCLVFGYKPDFSELDISWKRPTKETSRGGYAYEPAHSFGSAENIYKSVVPPSSLNADKDLVVIGENKFGDPILGLKSSNHELLKEFYGRYEEKAEDRSHWGNPPQEGIQGPKKSYEEFVAARPLFLWRDPFGRLIRFNNKDFLPIYMAEPIIYLYPQATQLMNVVVRPTSGKVNASVPKYESGWSITAYPSGILASQDKKTYPYLFWEGWASVLPMQDEGFVVARQEVNGFLADVLPKLGLNAKEAKDFIEAWLPRMSSDPYYFITFIDQSVIDRLAPLSVSPRPDTVIRILMDYRPLSQPKPVQPLRLPVPPKREGSVVVEWGGLRR